ncbi:MAG: hypothetical protein R3263_04005 [Myxococcota bacterium]|nr:hypothetical protein [Myxococcota bacterium]
MSEAAVWRRCSACKGPIPLGATYWACNVSTCNRKRTALAFCSVSCWEVHLPSANHREAWAVERTAPRTPDPEPSGSGEGGGRGTARSGDGREAGGGRRRIVRSSEPSRQDAASREVLIVASRLKDYVRAAGGMNTSDGVLEPLSDIVRRVCDEAVRNARREGRRTVLARDVPRG